MDIIGTTSKKLLAYINRVYDFLELDSYEAYVEVEFVKTCSHNASGYCHGDDQTILVEIARYDSDGRIPLKNIMINIAHELIHAKQIASGRLVNGGFRFNDSFSQSIEMFWVWEGKEFINTPYDEHPWEDEAYGLEEEVYNLCK